MWFVDSGTVKFFELKDSLELMFYHFWKIVSQRIIFCLGFFYTIIHFIIESWTVGACEQIFSDSDEDGVQEFSDHNSDSAVDWDSSYDDVQQGISPENDKSNSSIPDTNKQNSQAWYGNIRQNVQKPHLPDQGLQPKTLSQKCQV